jgi:hypothetical protein
MYFVIPGASLEAMLTIRHMQSAPSYSRRAMTLSLASYDIVQSSFRHSLVCNTLLRHGLNTSHLTHSLILLGTGILLHERESQEFLDTVIVCQEPNQAVNTHTPTTRWWQTVLKGIHEGLIDHLGFIITLSLLASLLFEQETVVEGVVQLRVGIHDFLLADESFEAFTETGLR